MNLKTYVPTLERRVPLINIVLRGIGQIMLQESALTGLLFLAGIFYGSVFMGLAAILAAFCGTMTAKIMGYDNSEIQKGLYGFSPALVGVALIFYFQPVFVIWLTIITGSAIAAILQHQFIVKRIPVFTLPFILVTWVILYLFKNLYLIAPSISPESAVSASHDFAFAFRGFAEVIFQAGAFAGMLFFAGIFVHSPISALYGLAASVLAAVLSFAFAAPAAGIGMGLFSYNAVLCAFVFAGTKAENGIWVLASTALSVVISLLMSSYHITPLTFPFVLASCITLLLKYLTDKILSRDDSLAS